MEWIPDIKTIIVTAVMLGTLVLEMILYCKGIIFQGKKKKREQAIIEGRVVKAYRSSFRGYWDKDVHKYSASYIYNVNGREYKKSGLLFDNFEPPESLTLYYDKRPDKAFADREVQGRSAILLAILPLLAAILLACILPG